MIYRALSDLEQTVMSIVWELKTCTVREVLDKLDKNRHLAYTTVMTIMTRMVQKGVLARNLQGHVYRYQPKVSKSSFVADSVRHIFAKTVSALGQEAVAYFAKEIQKLSPQKRKKLLELLAEQK